MQALTAPALYSPHGGGPLPLLGDAGHTRLIKFLSAVTQHFATPAAILVISAHWEEPVPTIQRNADPGLLYDYYGFPPPSYDLQYPAPGAIALADRLLELLTEAGIAAQVDATRGFDHGAFVPLSLMYPAARVPCLQLSLRADLHPVEHIQLGRALAPLRHENVLVLGSGSSFHNMQAFKDGDTGVEACAAFDQWLSETCCGADMQATADALADWQAAPHARYAHPREEHLLPLHVCFGTALPGGTTGERIFAGDVMGYPMSAFLWS
ncbi:MAG: class III extradiol ring-cleavage dioxygenase [Halioglobus sp.]|nr:class III extradiol ring-cleavage dioxygenase [Halioglobus sp.]